jgi:hypothetical protein
MMGGSVIRTARNAGRALSDAEDEVAAVGSCCASAARGTAEGEIAAARNSTLAVLRTRLVFLGMCCTTPQSTLP